MDDNLRPLSKLITTWSSLVRNEDDPRRPLAVDKRMISLSDRFGDLPSKGSCDSLWSDMITHCGEMLTREEWQTSTQASALDSTKTNIPVIRMSESNGSTNNSSDICTAGCGAN